MVRLRRGRSDTEGRADFNERLESVLRVGHKILVEPYTSKSAMCPVRFSIQTPGRT